MDFSKFFVLLFLCHGSYGVEIWVNTTHAPDLAAFGVAVRATLLSWFDQVGEILNSPTYTPPTVINIYFDPNYDGVAYAAGNQIVGSVDYYRRNSDIGSMVHEMAHVIQAYPVCYTNSDWWITEGIADWVRFFHFEPQNKPNRPTPSQSYRDGYRVTAYFLDFVHRRYNPMIYWVNKDCREGTYAHSIFPRLTGRTLDELWDDMLQEANELYPGEDFSHFVKPFSSNNADKCLKIQE